MEGSPDFLRLEKLGVSDLIFQEFGEGGGLGGGGCCYTPPGVVVMCLCHGSGMRLHEIVCFAKETPRYTTRTLTVPHPSIFCSTQFWKQGTDNIKIMLWDKTRILCLIQNNLIWEVLYLKCAFENHFLYANSVTPGLGWRRKSPQRIIQISLPHAHTPEHSCRHVWLSHCISNSHNLSLVLSPHFCVWMHPACVNELMWMCVY